MQTQTAHLVQWPGHVHDVLARADEAQGCIKGSAGGCDHIGSLAGDRAGGTNHDGGGLGGHVAIDVHTQVAAKSKRTRSALVFAWRACKHGQMQAEGTYILTTSPLFTTVWSSARGEKWPTTLHVRGTGSLVLVPWWERMGGKTQSPHGPWAETAVAMAQCITC